MFGFKASLTGLDRGGIRHLRPTLDSVGLFARDIDDIALHRPTLDDVFLSLTGHVAEEKAEEDGAAATAGRTR